MKRRSRNRGPLISGTLGGLSLGCSALTLLLGRGELYEKHGSFDNVAYALLTKPADVLVGWFVPGGCEGMAPHYLVAYLGSIFLSWACVGACLSAGMWLLIAKLNSRITR